MTHKLIKRILLFGLPLVGIGCLVGGTVAAILSATSPAHKDLVYPDEISLSGGVTEINAVTNAKTIANTPIKISSEPLTAKHDVSWLIVDQTTNETAPKQIYINNNNELVIDKGCPRNLDQDTFTIQAEFLTNNSSDSVKMSDNYLTFKLNLTYEPSNVIGIRWQTSGSTQMTTPAKKITYAEKPWSAEIQDRYGLWSPSDLVYELVSSDPKVNELLKVDNDGYLYSTGAATAGQTIITKIKATASDDSTYEVISDDITVTIIPDVSQTASLRFISSFNDAIINYHSSWISQMPFIASAYDQNNILIPNPQVTYYLVDNPNYVSIDSYGYLHVNSNNISTHTDATFDVYARSKDCPDVSISLVMKIVIMDTLSNELYNYDRTFGKIVSLKPKFATWLNSQSGILSIPSSFDGMPVRALGDHLFADLKGLKQVILPDSINEIDGACFANTPDLTSITINSAVNLLSGCLATGRSTSLIINNQTFANRMSDYLPIEQYDEETLTREVKTGGWHNQATSAGVAVSTTRSDDKNSNYGCITTTFSFTHRYMLSSMSWQLKILDGCLNSSRQQITTLTAVAGTGVTLPVNLQSNINNSVQYFSSQYKYLYSIRSSDAFKLTGNWAYCDVTYHRYVWNYNATYYSLYTSAGTRIAYSSLKLESEYNNGDATSKDESQQRSTFGTSVWILDANYNIMNQYSRYAKAGHWYDAGAWISHIDFDSQIQNRAVFTW